jgi:acetylornithine deacetylase/succinyl-diaminopimelate desuccinylase-like protein
VPWTFVEMESLPLNSSGKIDRRALPPPDPKGGAAAAAAQAYVAPRNDLERAIAEVWREVVGRERIGVDESFFSVGGSSLLVAKLQSRLRQALGREVPVLELFRHPTIASQARSLAAPPAATAGPPGAGPAAAAAAASPDEAAQAERVRTRSDSRREAMLRMQRRGRGGEPGDAGKG